MSFNWPLFHNQSAHTSPKGVGGYSLIWLIRGCAAGQGTVFGLFVLNRVYKFLCLLVAPLYRNMEQVPLPTPSGN